MGNACRPPVEGPGGDFQLSPERQVGLNKVRNGAGDKRRVGNGRRKPRAGRPDKMAPVSFHVPRPFVRERGGTSSYSSSSSFDAAWDEALAATTESVTMSMAQTGATNSQVMSQSAAPFATASMTQSIGSTATFQTRGVAAPVYRKPSIHQEGSFHGGSSFDGSVDGGSTIGGGSTLGSSFNGSVASVKSNKSVSSVGSLPSLRSVSPPPRAVTPPRVTSPNGDVNTNPFSMTQVNRKKPPTMGPNAPLKRQGTRRREPRGQVPDLVACDDMLKVECPIGAHASADINW